MISLRLLSSTWCPQDVSRDISFTCVTMYTELHLAWMPADREMCHNSDLTCWWDTKSR